MDDPRLAFVRELEQADEAVSVVLTELDELYEDCERVRERALELEVFFARLPDMRTATALAAEESRRRAEEARAAHERAGEELRAAEAEEDAERLASARRFELRTRDALTIAERRGREAQAEAARLESEAEAADRESEALGRRAEELAAALRVRPRLAADAGKLERPDLAGIAEWGTRARATLLVARGQLAAERDAVLRQANELGALVLGEPLSATSAAGVVRQVERELGAD